MDYLVGAHVSVAHPGAPALLHDHQRLERAKAVATYFDHPSVYSPGLDLSTQDVQHLHGAGSAAARSRPNEEDGNITLFQLAPLRFRFGVGFLQ
jgi:hypothetical protein